MVARIIGTPSWAVGLKATLIALALATLAMSGAGQAQSAVEGVIFGDPDGNPIVACPATFYEQSTSTALTCTCPANASGDVWGSGPYAADSAVCAAARHAGVLGSGGGTIQVAGASGCERYLGSSANGTTTYSWDDYSLSFVFPAAGRPQCPVAQTLTVNFVGLRCLQRADQFFLEDIDTVFAIASVVEQNGAVLGATTLPGTGEYFNRMRSGDVRAVNLQVWRGAAQDVTVFGSLYKFDPVLPDVAGALVGLTSGLAGAFIGAGSGGSAIAAGVVVASLGQIAAEKVRNELGNRARALGDASATVRLDRWFDLAGRPTEQIGNIGYHFSTTHTLNGGHYELYWLISR